MFVCPKIFPLDKSGTIYALQDGEGKAVGTGTREVCELLLHILKKQAAGPSPKNVLARIEKETSMPHQNVRSAIAI
jgi:hypothetical protein